MSDYSDLPALAGVHLEDSFVLGIRDTVIFTLEAVVQPGHPRYHAPRPGEQYCYLNAELVLGDASRIEWITRSGQVFTDATGEADLGNIDSLTHSNGHYELSGDWGEVHIETPTGPGCASRTSADLTRPPNRVCVVLRTLSALVELSPVGAAKTRC